VSAGSELDLAARARRAAEVAGAHANAVDRDARFPAEAVEALRRERLLGIYVPEAAGGEGRSLRELASVCEALARRCSAAAMVFAMHQIQAGCIVRHASGSAFGGYLTSLLERQRLIASATSEVGIGGDTRRSTCAIEAQSGRFFLEKHASVISYGSEADDILVTARRHPEAAPSDQVLALVQRSEFALEATSGWDTLGMRGTCSLGFRLTARGPLEHVLPAPFADVSAQTMVPFSHILWASVWLGIATEAAQRAHDTIRAEARKKPGTAPPGAPRLADLMNRVHGFRAVLAGALAEYESRMGDPDALASLPFAVRMNNLKITASEAVVDIASKALLLCGIAGYRCDTEVSMGRLLRDAFSAPVMIQNDRLRATNAMLLLALKEA
jgi:acyl-CoA dehydrogenase